MILPTNLYEEAMRRLDELKSIADEKEMAVQKAPQGKIHTIKSRAKVQYYLREKPSDPSGKYLSKNNVSEIQKYLQKSYDEKILSIIKKEIKQLESFIKHSQNINQRIKEIYSINPNEIKQQIDPIDCMDADYIKMWLNIPYEGNAYPFLGAKYKTERGENVRSKSELNIANSLNRMGIPYKYECPLILKTKEVVYPDFTVLDVKRRREIYWEHRGMMDDREYARKAIKKLKEYNQNNIIIGDNLIITEETTNEMLGTEEIYNIIKNILVYKK